MRDDSVRLFKSDPRQKYAHYVIFSLLEILQGLILILRLD